MAYRDMRDYLAVLQQQGLVRRINRETDHNWEVACLAKWMYQALPVERRFGLYFDNIKGSKIHVVTGALGASPASVALALQCNVEEINDKVVEALRRPLKPRVVQKGFCQDVAHTGSDASLHKLPIVTWTPGKDKAPYLTTIVVTRDHEVVLTSSIEAPRMREEQVPGLEVVTYRWYDGPDRPMEIATGTALWFHPGIEPLPIRWVLARDPEGRLTPRAWFSTRPEDAGASVVAEFVLRWPLEVTFEESRAHLGVETQRQWSDLAIARQTPCLFGLYSLIAVLGARLHAESPIAVRAASWYPKSEPTFSDVLAAVRKRCWQELSFLTGHRDPAYRNIPMLQFEHLINAACYSH